MMKPRIRWAILISQIAGLSLCPLTLASDENHAAEPDSATVHTADSGHKTAGGHGEEHAEPSLFAGDLGNAFWTVLIFVILLVVLGKFAWPAILGALQKREEFIRESLESAKRDREAAEARLKEYEARITTARSEATAIVEEGRRDAEALKRKIEETSRAESEALVQRAKRDIGLAKDTAVKELYDKSAELAMLIATRVIRKEMDPSQHQQLIADAIASVGTVSKN